MTLATLIAGRSPKVIDAMIRLGMFLIELRPKLVRGILEDPKVKELVDAVMEFSAAYGLRDSAYGKLLEEAMNKVQPDRPIGANRAHVLLNYMPVPDAEGGLKRKDSKLHDGFVATSITVDVAMNIYENNLGLNIVVAYSSTLFKRDTITRILKDLEQILEEFVRNPAKRILELNVGPPPRSVNGRQLDGRRQQC
jgi:hypothetical protein